MSSTIRTPSCALVACIKCSSSAHPVSLTTPGSRTSTMYDAVAVTPTRDSPYPHHLSFTPCGTAGSSLILTEPANVLLCFFQVLYEAMHHHGPCPGVACDTCHCFIVAYCRTLTCATSSGNAVGYASLLISFVWNLFLLGNALCCSSTIIDAPAGVKTTKNGFVCSTSGDIIVARVTLDAVRVTRHDPLGRVTVSVIVVMDCAFTATVSTRLNVFVLFFFYSHDHS